MPSSMASNSSISGAARAANTSQESDVPDRLRGSKDIGWDYDKFVKLNNYREVQCRKCKKIMYRRINRHKQHIIGMGGKVAKCFLETDEKRRLYRENLDTAKMKWIKNDRL